MSFNPETAGTVAYASACVLVGELYAGADADRQAELIVLLAPRLESVIQAYCEAAGGRFALPAPSDD